MPEISKNIGYKYRLFIAILYLVLSANYCSSQKAKIFICSKDKPVGLDEFIKKQKVGHIPIIYNNDIDPNDDGILDVALFIKKILFYFPNKKDTGICVLDWEGKLFETIESKAKAGKPADFEIAQYIKAIKIAKKERPKVKWGFYDMHIREYYNRTAAWKKANDVFLPLYKESDILFPSIYDFYPDSVLGKKAQYEYLDDNIQVVLKLAKVAKKPVYAFVWHRFHDSTPEYGLTAMEKKQFQEHMEKILSNRAGSYRVTGLVWWMEDAYWFNGKKERVLMEAASFSTFNDYQNAIWSRYVDAMKMAVKNIVN